MNTIILLINTINNSNNNSFIIRNSNNKRVYRVILKKPHPNPEKKQGGGVGSIPHNTKFFQFSHPYINIVFCLFCSPRNSLKYAFYGVFLLLYINNKVL